MNGVTTEQLDSQEYSMDQTYKIGDVIEHPSFGTGRVIANLKKGKIEVEFKEIGVRTLVTNYRS